MNEPGILYVVGTPIGNLRDITLRAIEVLSNVDSIVCEDTRVTLKLLNRYKIKKQLISFHSKSRDKVAEKILDHLLQGSNLALVSDSGIPIVSDPGGKIIELVRKRGVSVVPVPGPSAAHTVLMASGLRFSEYSFLGFLSRKSSGRKKRLRELKEHKTVFVFFESPHRLLSFLKDVEETLGSVRVYVGKEMTKRFEKYYMGLIGEVVELLRQDGIRGEYTIVVDNR